jgi:hypothetical protein
VEWTRISGEIVLEFLPDLAGEPEDCLGMFCQAQSRWSRSESLAAADKKLSV